MGFQSIRPLVPFKKPEAVRCRIHQNKENGWKGTRLALAARTSRKANSEWLSIWPSLGSYREPFGIRFSISEEHTSELQSHLNILCRLLLVKKKITPLEHTQHTMTKH